MIEILSCRTDQDEEGHQLRDESISFVCVDNGDPKCSNQTDAECGDDTPNGNGQATSIDRGNDLSADDASKDAKADLLDQVEDADEFGRPIAHDIATKDLYKTDSDLVQPIALSCPNCIRKETGASPLGLTIVRLPLSGPKVEV